MAACQFCDEDHDERFEHQQSVARPVDERLALRTACALERIANSMSDIRKWLDRLDR